MAKIKLVVTQPFGDRAIGDEITDPAEVEKVRESHPHYAVPVEVTDPDDDAPAKPAGK